MVYLQLAVLLLAVPLLAQSYPAPPSLADDTKNIFLMSRNPAALPMRLLAAPVVLAMLAPVDRCAIRMPEHRGSTAVSIPTMPSAAPLDACPEDEIRLPKQERRWADPR